MDADTSLEKHAIKDFEKVFWCAEANRSDDVFWTKFPVSRKGTSYSRLMRDNKGRTAFCVFIALVRLCARNKTKGRLTLKGKAITGDDLAAESGIQIKAIEDSIRYLKSKEIGWLVPEGESEEDRPSVDEKSTANRSPLAGGRTRASSSSSSSGSSSSEEGGAGGTKPTAADFGKPTPHQGLSGNWNPFELERVVAHYPKRCKPIRARQAVDKAAVMLVQRGITEPLDFLEERVNAYAKAVESWPAADRKWVPDPHTWFNDGSYDDDEATWRRDSAQHSDGPTTAVGKGGF